ncbi:FAR1 DNA-binding domain [Sesbania bispinosa]|nr:FAR1 DNA-binding domain [Sesbania bispinosa]
MDGAIEINQGNNILSLELQQALEAPFDLNEAPFDLNELPLEEENLSNDLDTIFEPLEEENPSHASNIIFEPFVGQCFSNEEKALEFYQRYAKQHGFSVRKARFDKNKNGEVRRRDFFCHRAGRQPLKIVYPSKDQRHRSSARSDCKAHMRIKLKKYVDIFPDEWHVVEFIAEHNHELLSEEETRFLRSHRTITKEDENLSLGEEGPLLVDEENGEDNNEMEMIDLLQCPPKSKTKGRPKQKRLRGGKELSINKQVKKCRLCKHPGHNFTT